MPPLSTGCISGSEKIRSLWVYLSVATAISVGFPPRDSPYSISTLLGRFRFLTTLSATIFPFRSNTYKAPSSFLSVSSTRLCEGSSGLIHIAGSSLSYFTFSVTTAGRMIPAESFSCFSDCGAVRHCASRSSIIPACISIVTCFMNVIINECFV